MSSDDVEFITLPDGRRVYRDGRVEEAPVKETKVRGMVEVPNAQQAQQIIANSRKKIADLPALPQTMNAVSVVLTYSLFGLQDQDIAIATGLSEEQVINIKMLDAYNTMYEAVARNLLEADSDDIRNVFKQHARNAADKIAKLVDSEKDVIALNAAKDMLDRAGHRPAEIVKHQHSMNGVLQVEYIKKDESISAPLININPRSVTDVRE